MPGQTEMFLIFSLKVRVMGEKEASCYDEEDPTLKRPITTDTQWRRHHLQITECKIIDNEDGALLDTWIPSH